MRECIYYFHFNDGSVASFPVDSIGELPATELPAWTRLDFHQCPNCPLTPATHPHCPMAARFAGLVELGAHALAVVIDLRALCLLPFLAGQRMPVNVGNGVGFIAKALVAADTDQHKRWHDQERQ